MKKLLLTGASGFLGWNICKLASSDWAVYGLVNNTSVNFPGVTFHRQDLTDALTLRSLFRKINPEAVIHTAANPDPNYCQLHAEETHRINVIATQTLAELCAESKIPFVFTSTDLVFDGMQGDYKETDAINPISIYGEQKVEAENRIRKIYPEAAICRMPFMLGAGGESKKGYLQSFLEKAGKGESLKLFVDELRTPLGGVSAAKGLLHAATHFKGTYHLGGKEKMSRFDIGQKIAQVFGIPTANLSPSKQADVPMPAARPADVSFDSSKAFKEGFTPVTILEELKVIKAAMI